MKEQGSALPPDVRDKMLALCEQVRGQLGVGIAALARSKPQLNEAIWREAERLTGLRRSGKLDDFEDLQATARRARAGKGDGVGDQIGPYHIVRELGKGGMGVVYLAEQTDGVRRHVALKVIRAGVDLDQVLARFALERQALAVMSHVNIARVFEAGETDDGLPYFVMEYVPGVPITDYCNEHQLTLRQRVALFQQVCAGVQHAHQKGVIHRDLTARNVMVTEEDGAPLVKIIDFGLARATDLELLQQSLCTQAGLVVGTPEYMSPEQISGVEDVDTRTDVYSLGVLLFQVLVDALPFTREAMKQGGFGAMQRMIMEQDPPRPSTIIQTLEAASALALARQREASPGALMQTLRNELDWIVLRCLEKDRNRRYETPSALSDELTRFLRDEPISAGPPTAGYRVRKFVRRYRKHVLAAAAVGLCLVGGIVATSTAMVQAEHNAKKAVTAADRARLEKIEADRQRERADSNAQSLLEQSERLRQQTILALASRRVESDPWLSLAYLRELSADSRLAEDSLQVAYDALGPRAERWSCQARLLGHEGRITGVAISPDGRLVVTTSLDATARIWNILGGEPAVLRHPDEVHGVLFAPQGRGVLTLCRDRVMRLWGVSGADRPVEFERAPGALVHVRFDSAGDRLVTISDDGSACLWDARRPAASPVSLGSGVLAVAFSPDERRVLAVADRRVRLFRQDGSAEIYDIRHEDRVTHAAFSSDGNHVLSASIDKTAKVTRLDSLTQQVTFAHPAGVLSIAQLEDGRVLTAAEDHQLRVFSIDGGEAIATIGATSIVAPPVLTADQRAVAVVGGDHAVRLFDLQSGAEPTVFRHDGEIRQVRFVGGKQELLTLGADGHARIWSARSPHRPRLLEHPGHVELASLCDDPLLLVTAATDGGARLWTPRTLDAPLAMRRGESLATTVAEAGDSVAIGYADGQVALRAKSDGRVSWTKGWSTEAVTALAFDPTGQALVVGYTGGMAHLVNVSDGAMVTLSGHSGAVACVAFSSDGQRIATGGHDSKLRIWNREGTLLRELDGHKWHVVGAAFSPDCGRVASACWDGYVRIWDLSAPDAEPVSVRHPDLVHTLTFAPDGQRLASGCQDGTVRVFGVGGGDLPLVLEGHTRAVRCVAFRPDGKQLVTAGSDHTVRVWDSATRNDGVIWRGHAHEVLAASYDQTGTRILTASRDGTARVWPTDGRGPSLVLRHGEPVLDARFSGSAALTVTADAVRFWSLDWRELHAWLQRSDTLPLASAERAGFGIDVVVPAAPGR